MRLFRWACLFGILLSACGDPNRRPAADLQPPPPGVRLRAEPVCARPGARISISPGEVKPGLALTEWARLIDDRGSTTYLRLNAGGFVELRERPFVNEGEDVLASGLLSRPWTGASLSLPQRVGKYTLAWAFDEGELYSPFVTPKYEAVVDVRVDAGC